MNREIFWKGLLKEEIRDLQDSLIRLLKLKTIPNIPTPEPRLFRITKRLRWPAIASDGHPLWYAFEDITNKNPSRATSFHLFHDKTILQFIEEDTRWHPRLIYQTFRALKRAKEWCLKKVQEREEEIKKHNPLAGKIGIADMGNTTITLGVPTLTSHQETVKEKIALLEEALIALLSVQTIPAVPFPTPPSFAITKNVKWPGVDERGRPQLGKAEIRQNSLGNNFIQLWNLRHLPYLKDFWQSIETGEDSLHQVLETLEEAILWVKKKTEKRKAKLERLLKRRKNYIPYPYEKNPLLLVKKENKEEQKKHKAPSSYEGLCG